MKVRELLALLQGIDPEREVVLALDQDPFGEWDDGRIAFKPLADVARTQWFLDDPDGSGDVAPEHSGEVDGRWVPAVVLWSFSTQEDEE